MGVVFSASLGIASGVTMSQCWVQPVETKVCPSKCTHTGSGTFCSDCGEPLETIVSGGLTELGRKLLGPQIADDVDEYYFYEWPQFGPYGEHQYGWVLAGQEQHDSDPAYIDVEAVNASLTKMQKILADRGIDSKARVALYLDIH